MAIAEIPVSIEWGYGHGSPGANVWHARTDAPAPGGDFDDQVGWIQQFYEDIAGLFNSTCTIRFEGEIRGVGADTGNSWTAPSWSVSGTDSGSVAPPMLCMLVQWRTMTGGRHGRGRTFIGPLADSVLESNGTPDEPDRATLQAAADALIESSDTATNGALGVYSRTEELLRDFVSANVPNDFAVLRSRRD